MKPYALQKASDDNGFETAWAAGANDRDGPDHCSREGAAELKRKIEAYWAERGYDVMIVLHNVGFHAAIRAARFDVRSDMINGMPRPKKAGIARPQAEEVYVEDFDKDGDDIAFE